MTQEQLEKWWHVIEAQKNGKQIQMMGLLKENPKWTDTSDPNYYSEHVEYRVKPEPEYVPFDFSDAEMLIGKYVKRKDGSEYVQTIVQVQTDMVHIGVGVINYKNLFESCVFLDGSPCGKLKS